MNKELDELYQEYHKQESEANLLPPGDKRANRLFYLNKAFNYLVYGDAHRNKDITVITERIRQLLFNVPETKED